MSEGSFGPFGLWWEDNSDEGDAYVAKAGTGWTVFRLRRRFVPYTTSLGWQPTASSSTYTPLAWNTTYSSAATTSGIGSFIWEVKAVNLMTGHKLKSERFFSLQQAKDACEAVWIERCLESLP